MGPQRQQGRSFPHGLLEEARGMTSRTPSSVRRARLKPDAAFATVLCADMAGIQSPAIYTAAIKPNCIPDSSSHPMTQSLAPT